MANLNNHVNAQITGADETIPVKLASSGTPTITEIVTGENIGAINDTWADLIQVATTGAKQINLWVEFTKNDSLGAQIQVLCRRATGGSNFVLESTADYQKTIGDATIKILYSFNVEGVPFIMLQSKATTVGATPGIVTINSNLIY